MRRAEIDGLCWTQINFKRAEVRIINHEHFEAKTDESEGVVFVDAGLLSELHERRDAITGMFVVEPGTKAGERGTAIQHYRCHKTFDRVNAWLRLQGVMADKPLHDLRKEFGSIVAAQSDIFSASRQLRHANIATTAAYYADHRKRSTVPISEMLKRANP